MCFLQPFMAHLQREEGVKEGRHFFLQHVGAATSFSNSGASGDALGIFAKCRLISILFVKRE